MDQTEYNRKIAVLSLSFGQRAKIAWKLSCSRFVPFLLVGLGITLTCGLAWTAIGLLSVYIFPIFMILGIPLFFITFYLGLGLYLSLLRCLDGVETTFQLSTIFEPLRRWQTLFPATLALFGIALALLLLLAIISIIPFIGWIVMGVSSYLLIIIQAAYYFFIAENIGQPVGILITAPIKLITPSMNRWGPALGAYILAIIPCTLLMVIGMILLITADPYFLDGAAFYGELDYGYDLSAPKLAGGIIFMLLGIAAGFVGGVFSMFMFAIAYRQSLIDREFMMIQSQGQFMGQQNINLYAGRFQAPPASPQQPPHNLKEPGN